jgi:hypothetical protein
MAIEEDIKKQLIEMECMRTSHTSSAWKHMCKILVAELRQYFITLTRLLAGRTA